MVNLRNTLTEILDTSSLSVRSAMQQLGFDGLASVRELVRAVASGNTGQFTPLFIESDGSGMYRADRFRIYFIQLPSNIISPTIRHIEEIPIPTRINELGNIFPQLFNGFGSDVNGIEGIEQNNATTFYRQDKPFNGEPTLQFTFDATVLFNFIDVPDIHDDWVGFVHQDNFSFAVQTLKRHFTENNDIGFGLAVAELLAFAITTPLVGAILGIGGGILVSAINRYHFLAGRRSWRIGRTTAEITFLENSFTIPVFFFETAAIDRFSTWVVDLLTETGNVGLGEIDELVKGVWKRLLLNYLAFGKENYRYRSLDYFSIEPSLLANTIAFSTSEEGVYIDQRDFQSKEELFAQAWVQEILQFHPGIASQF